MVDIRQKLGLDYLKKAKAGPGSEEPPGPSGPAAEASAFLEEAAIVLGVRVLDFLANQPDGAGKLFEVVETTEMPIEEALRVTEVLKTRNLLEVVEKDRFGNHGLKITAEGRRYIGAAAG